MKFIDYTGQEYDFDRCTKDQLAAYVVDMTRNGFSESLYSSHQTGQAILAAAKVPSESKATVAKELAEYVAERLQVHVNIGNHNGIEAEIGYHIRRFAERYSKAADK